MSKPKIICVRESFAQSVLSDLSTFGFVVGSVWFNQTFCGGSYFLSAIILIMFILFIIGRIGGKAKRFMTADEAIAYLKNESPEQ